jgi:hypothetical protein
MAVHRGDKIISNPDMFDFPFEGVRRTRKINCDKILSVTTGIGAGHFKIKTEKFLLR